MAVSSCVCWPPALGSNRKRKLEPERCCMWHPATLNAALLFPLATNTHLAPGSVCYNRREEEEEEEEAMFRCVMALSGGSAHSSTQPVLNERGSSVISRLASAEAFGETAVPSFLSHHRYKLSPPANEWWWGAAAGSAQASADSSAPFSLEIIQSGSDGVLRSVYMVVQGWRTWQPSEENILLMDVEEEAGLDLDWIDVVFFFEFYSTVLLLKYT